MHLGEGSCQEAIQAPQPQLPDNATVVLQICTLPMCAMLLTASEESVMVLMPVLCPHCHSDQVIKGGKTKAGQ